MFYSFSFLMDTVSSHSASVCFFLMVMTFADIPSVGGIGFAFLAIAMVGAGVLFERLLRKLLHGTGEGS